MVEDLCGGLVRTSQEKPITPKRYDLVSDAAVPSEPVRETYEVSLFLVLVPHALPPHVVQVILHPLLAPVFDSLLIRHVRKDPPVEPALDREAPDEVVGRPSGLEDPLQGQEGTGLRYILLQRIAHWDVPEACCVDT